MSNIVNNNNPIRIRSKICLLEYPKLRKENVHDLKGHIASVFKFKLDSDWSYIFKEERFLKNSSCVIVFIECKVKPDVYSFNLNFSVRDVEHDPRVWCFTDRELPMYVIMKLSNEHIKNLYTNIPLPTLQNYHRIIDCGKPNLHTTVDKIVEISDKVVLKKALNQKQRDKINKHMLVFDSLYPDAFSNLCKLKKLTTNMRNYRYSHECPSEVNSDISRYEKLYSIALKNSKT